MDAIICYYYLLIYSVILLLFHYKSSEVRAFPSLNIVHHRCKCHSVKRHHPSLKSPRLKFNHLHLLINFA